jgi:hypothetical protein
MLSGLLGTIASAIFSTLLNYFTSWYKEAESESNKWNAASEQEQLNSVIIGKQIEDVINKGSVLPLPKTIDDLKGLLG